MSLADAATYATAQWPLDEASGTRFDSVNSNDLSDANTVGSTTGQFGTAADFTSASSEYLHMGDTADVSIGDVDACWRLWVRADSPGAFPVLFSKGAAGDDREYILFYDVGAGRLNWSVRGGGTTTTVQWGSALSAGVTYLIHVWHDATGNQIGIAVNAGTAVTTSHTTGVQDLAGDFEIGASSGQSLFWDGWIDDFVILKGRFLDATERTADYNGGAGVAFADWPDSGGGGGDVTVALSGSAATASAGSVSPSTACGLSGSSGTGAAGTLAALITLALSGQSSTGSAGTVTPSTTVGLSGSQATTAAGTVTPEGDVTVALSGQSVTCSAGTLTATGGDATAGGTVRASVSGGNRVQAGVGGGSRVQGSVGGGNRVAWVAIPAGH